MQVTRNKKVQLVRGIDRREEEEEEAVNDKRIRIIFAVVGDTHVVTHFIQVKGKSCIRRPSSSSMKMAKGSSLPWLAMPLISACHTSL